MAQRWPGHLGAVRPAAAERGGRGPAQVPRVWRATMREQDQEKLESAQPCHLGLDRGGRNWPSCPHHPPRLTVQHGARYSGQSALTTPLAGHSRQRQSEIGQCGLQSVLYTRLIELILVERTVAVLVCELEEVHLLVRDALRAVDVERARDGILLRFDLPDHTGYTAMTRGKRQPRKPPCCARPSCPTRHAGGAADRWPHVVRLERGVTRRSRVVLEHHVDLAHQTRATSASRRSKLAHQTRATSASRRSKF